MLLSPIAGFVIGWVGAIPAGPLGVAVMSNGLRGKPRHAASMVFGGVLSDFLYCAIAMLGFSQIFHNRLQSLPVRIGITLLLVAFGIKTMLSVPEPSDEPQQSSASFSHNSFLMGFFILMLNPSLLITWGALSATIHSNGLIGTGIWENLLFSLGAAGGMAGWLFTLLYFVSKHRRRIPQGGIRLFVRLCGAALVVFGIGCFFGVGVK